MAIKRSLPSFSVAVKKTAFGEGAERVAFKFRFVDSVGRFVGPTMVAKESRFVQDQLFAYHHGNVGGAHLLSSHQRAYHTQFLQVQAIAARFADLLYVFELSTLVDLISFASQLLCGCFYSLVDCQRQQWSARLLGEDGTKALSTTAETVSADKIR